MTLALQQRLLGGNRIHWRSVDVDRIAKRFGSTAADLNGMLLRASSAGAAPSIELAAETTSGALKQATFTISTPEVDRMEDTIAVHAWRLRAFNANPVVQYAHDGGSLPIGRAVKTWIEANRLKSTVEFDDDRFAQRVAAMVKSGTLRAASVGFTPGQWEFSKDKSRPNGIDFISGHTLLEWSVVNVPANASCLCESIVGQKSASGASKTPKLDTARRKIARLRSPLAR